MKPPTLSRPAGKLFLLFLIHFGRHLTITHLFGFGVDLAAAFTPQMIKRQSQSLFERAT
jgi:hypothetical protein